MEPEEFIEVVVKKWMYHDIEEAIKGKANILTALGLMTYTEIMGGLITGNLRGEIIGIDENGKIKKHSRSEDNFKKCINDLFPNEYKNYMDILYEKVRSGLAHEYFIKERNENSTVKYFIDNLGIIENNPDDPKGEKDYGLPCAITIDNNRVIFHVNQYFKDFKKAVEKYLKEVHESEAIRDNFYRLFPKYSTDASKITKTSGQFISYSGKI